MATNKTYFIIDFDSTFVRIEALDKLAEIALKNQPDKNERLKKIKAITEKGMRGELPFDQALEERLELFAATKKDIEKLVGILRKNITASVKRNKEFFKRYKDYIYVISGGFKEYIYPLFKPLGINKSHILANEFRFKAGKIIGFDKKNFLAQAGGKVKQMKALKLKGRVYVIGDGFTDLEIRQAGLADKFFVMVENVRRENVAGKADYILPNLDEFLYVNKLPRAYSYPKNRLTAKVWGKIREGESKSLVKEGYRIEKMGGVKKKIEIWGRSLHAVGTTEADAPKGVVVFGDKAAKRLIRFMNTGETSGSVNFPRVKLPALKGAHRIIHIHHNVPGVLANLNSILAKRGVNILGQYLATNEEVGIVLIDVNKTYNEGIIQEIKNLPTTIKLRVLY